MIIVLIALILGIIGLMVINRKTKRKSVVIRNLRYRQLNEPMKIIDYSRYHEGIEGEK